MPTHVRVLLVGFGYAGQTFHLPLLRACSGYELVALVSQSAAPHDPRLHGVQIFTSLTQALEHSGAELVVIATPNATHHEFATAALRAGKHVVIDKPFTVTLTQADSLTAIAHEQQRVLTVFHNRRWDSDWIELQHVLSQDWLGPWVHVESRMDRFRPQARQRWRESTQAGAGLWFDLGPHMLDQALLLFGRPDSLQLDLAAQRDTHSGVDWFHAVLAYGTKRVLLHASVVAAQSTPRWLVHGLRGSYLKHGHDPQEDALKRGMPPNHPDFGLDPNPGTLTLAQPQGLDQRTLAPSRGHYLAFYSQLHTALVQPGVEPAVTMAQAREVMYWLARGHAVAASQP